jgi:hypothetical protein
MNPVHTLPPCFLNIQPNVMLPSMPMSSKWLIPFWIYSSLVILRHCINCCGYEASNWICYNYYEEPWRLSVGIALGYGLDDRGSRVRFSAELGIFIFTTASRLSLRPIQPPIQWVPGLFPWGWSGRGRETGHSPPSSAKVKMRGAIPPLPNTPS